MKILFVTATRIGDAILSTGILDWLAREYPEARVTLACGAPAAPLFAATPMVERVFPLTKQRFGGHWRGLWRACVATRWDLIVDLRDSPLSYFLRARRRRIFRSPRRPIHRVAAFGALFGLDPPPVPRLWIADSHRRAASEITGGQEPIIALGPTANWAGKIWPAERFAALAARIAEPGGLAPGATVVVLGAESERDLAAPLLSALPAEKRVDMMGGTDLLTAYAVLQRCNLYVGNDSGLMHLAAASGVPTLGLFGPSREQYHRPWGARAAVVRTPESFDDFVNAPGYDHRNTGSLMQSLSVDAVYQAAEALFVRCARQAA